MSKPDPIKDATAALRRARTNQKARFHRGEKPPPHPMQAIWDADDKREVEAIRKSVQQRTGGYRSGAGE